MTTRAAREPSAWTVPARPQVRRRAGKGPVSATTASAAIAAPARPASANPKPGAPAKRRKRRRSRGGGARGRPVSRKWRRRRQQAAAQPEVPQPLGRTEPESDRYAEGFLEGVFAGGERLLEEYLPTDLLIPNLTLEEALAAGVQALRSRGVPLLGTEGVYEEIERALAERQPYALVRLGDGELLTMAQDVVLPAEDVRKAGYFLSYAGVEIPNLRARDELASAVRLASRIGVPLSRRPHFQPLLFALWNAAGIQAEATPLTFSTINYALYEQGYLARLLAGRRILVIGNVAAPLARVLTAQGVGIAGAISPVRGVSDWHRVVEEASACDFDLALVSAGIAAVPICVHLAGRTGKVAIDFGHQANIMAGVQESLVRREGLYNRR